MPLERRARYWQYLPPGYSTQLESSSSAAPRAIILVSVMVALRISKERSTGAVNARNHLYVVASAGGKVAWRSDTGFPRI